MSESQMFDVIITGNGILGYSTAFALSIEDPSLKIAIIGPDNKSGSASIAAGAMIVSFSELEKGLLDSDFSKSKFDMSLKSANMWPEWIEQINETIKEDALSLNQGINVILNMKVDESDDENFEVVVSALKEYNEKYFEVDPRTVSGMSPAPDGRVSKAIFIPCESSIKSVNIAAAFEKYFSISKNIKLLNGLATKLTIKDNGIKELQVNNEIILCSSNLIIACGAKSQELIDQIPSISKKIPKLFYGVGTGIIAKTHSFSPLKTIRTLNRGLACGVHVVPYDKDYCYIGASNFITPIPEYHPRMTSLYALLQSAMEQINTRFYKAQVKKVVVGHRPTTVDTFPLIGETSVKGLWILSGTKRDGIHMSPLLAQSIAGEILGRKSLFQNKFLPERKPIHTMTKEEGIKKAVKHLKSAGYQHELSLPKAGWEEMLEDMLRNKVEDIYDKCGIKDFGIPPEMLDMYKYGHVIEIEKSPSLSVV